jgi:hypothetical protein
MKIIWPSSSSFLTEGDEHEAAEIAAVPRVSPAAPTPRFWMKLRLLVFTI